MTGCQLVFALEEESDSANCSPISMIADDFDGDVAGLGRFWREFEDGDIDIIEDGRLRLSAGNNESGGIAAASYFDLRNGSISADVEIGFGGLAGDTTDSFTSLDLISTIEPGPGKVPDLLSMVVSRGNLIAGRYENGNYFEVGRLDYDPVLHRRWRIAQRGSSFIWEVATADGSFTRFQEFQNLPITYVTPRLYFGCLHDMGCTSSFDKVNGGGDPIGAACKTSTLEDDFDEPAIDSTKWRPLNGDCTWSQRDGALVATSADPTTVGELCTLESSTVRDFTTGSIAIEIVQPLAQRLFFGALTLDDKSVYFSLEGTTLKAIDGATGGAFQTLAEPFDLDKHRFWRLRAIDNLVHFEYSGNGVDYTFFASTGNLGARDLTRFRFGIDGAGSGDVLFDNFNVVP